MYQLACALALLPLMFPNAGFVCLPGPSDLSESVLRPIALFALCKFGIAIAKVELDICISKFRIQHQLPLPTQAPHQQDCTLLLWQSSLKLLRAQKNQLINHLKELRSVSQNLWRLTFGPSFMSSTYYVQWERLARCEFSRGWDSALPDLKTLLSNKVIPLSSFSNSVHLAEDDNIVNVVNVPISPQTSSILSKTPKFCMAVKPSRLEVAAAVEKVASRISDLSCKSAFTDLCVSHIPSNAFKDHADKNVAKHLATVKEELRRKELTLVQCDKSGKFGLLPDDVFARKADEAIKKLFKPFSANLCKIKKSISDILFDSNVALGRKIRESRTTALAVKFFLKDHKVDMPLRVVVSEVGTWQKLLSGLR